MSVENTAARILMFGKIQCKNLFICAKNKMQKNVYVS